MDLIFKNLLWAAFAYIVIVVALYIFQRGMMYFPDTNKTLLPSGINEFTVQTEDGLDLTGWFLKGEPDKPTIVYFHGNALAHANRVPRVMPYVEAGYSVLLAGYRGYGGNPGKPSEAGLYKDARAYINALNTQNIILYGESLGTGVAVQMATEYPNVKALVLEAPYTSTVDIAAWRFFWVPVRFLMKDRFESIAKIQNINAPLIILHGKRDRVIPFRFGRELYEAASEPKVFIPFEDADHNNLLLHGGAQGVLSNLP